MIAPRELATQLAGSIFDHVERERTLVRHSIEDVLHDGLLLGLAKHAATPAKPSGAAGTSGQEVVDAAKVLCARILNSTGLQGVPGPLSRDIENIYFALLRTGWTP